LRFGKTNTELIDDLKKQVNALIQTTKGICVKYKKLKQFDHRYERRLYPIELSLTLLLNSLNTLAIQANSMANMQVRDQTLTNLKTNLNNLEQKLSDPSNQNEASRLKEIISGLSSVIDTIRDIGQQNYPFDQKIQPSLKEGGTSTGKVRLQGPLVEIPPYSERFTNRRKPKVRSLSSFWKRP